MYKPEQILVSKTATNPSQYSFYIVGRIWNGWVDLTLYSCPAWSYSIETDQLTNAFRELTEKEEEYLQMVELSKI